MATPRRTARARPAVSYKPVDGDDSDEDDSHSRHDDEEQQQQQPENEDDDVVVVVPAPAERSRYETRRHYDIMKEVKQTILYQNCAMLDVGDLLLELHSEPSGFYKGVRARIFKRIFSGPSGVGKTETVRAVLQHRLCMAPGDYYARQFVHIDGSVYRDVTQLNRLCGSGPGYANCESRHTLVDDLCAAAKSPAQALLERCGTDKKSAVYRAAEARVKQEGTAPPFILLFIDEIDKTHCDFMSIINGLLDEGEMKSSQGRLFRLPDATRLVVIFASNYGAAQIARMRYEDPQEGAHWVEEAMRAHGLAPNSIERFGRHIIFYPIKPHDMAVLVRRKVEQFMRAGQLSREYGAVECGQAMQCVTEFVQQISDPEKGVRGGLKHLDACLTPLLFDAFHRLQCMPRAQVQALLEGAGRPMLQLFKETLALEVLDDEDARDAWVNQRWDRARDDAQPNGYDMVRAIQADERNARALEKIRSSETRAVHAFGIARGTNVINCMIVPLIVNQYKITQYSSDDHRALHQDYAELKERYCDLRDAVAEGDEARIAEHMQAELPEERAPLAGDAATQLLTQVEVGETAMVQKRRRVGDAGRAQPLLFEALDEPEAKPRKRVTNAPSKKVREAVGDDTASDDDAQPVKGGKVSKRKLVEGFTFLRLENRHALHSCNECGRVCDARYARNHKCENRLV